MTWLVYRSGSGREDNLPPRMPLLKEPAGTTDSFDWDSIHRAVQEILETLTSWVVSRALRLRGNQAGVRPGPFLSSATEFSIGLTATTMIRLSWASSYLSRDRSPERSATSRGMSPGASISMRDVPSRFPHTRTLSSTPLASSRIVSSCQGRLCLTPSAIATSISLYAESMPVRSGVSAHAHGNREAVVR